MADDGAAHRGEPAENSWRAIPQKLWRTWSGRQTKQLHEQAARYGIPFGGATIDLPAVVSALHDFLARNARRLSATAADPEQPGADESAESSNLEEFRKWRALQEQFKYERMRGQWIRRDELHRALGLFAGALRSAGERLQKTCGREAHAILDEALGDGLSQIEQFLARSNETLSSDPSNPTDPDSPSAADPQGSAASGTRAKKTRRAKPKPRKPGPPQP